MVNEKEKLGGNFDSGKSKIKEEGKFDDYCYNGKKEMKEEEEEYGEFVRNIKRGIKRRKRTR